MNDKHKEAHDFFNKLRTNFASMDDRCAYYRGVFIHHATLLETQIDDLLSNYFCPDDFTKRDELLYLVFSSERSTFMGKYVILSFIMQRHFKEFYEKHTPKPLKKKKNQIPPASLDTRVNKVITLRNKFAHRKFIKALDQTLSFDGDSISLDTKIAKDGRLEKSELLLNKEKITEYCMEIKELMLILNQLSYLMRNKKE